MPTLFSSRIPTYLGHRTNGAFDRSVGLQVEIPFCRRSNGSVENRPRDRVEEYLSLVFVKCVRKTLGRGVEPNVVTLAYNDDGDLLAGCPIHGRDVDRVSESVSTRISVLHRTGLRKLLRITDL